MQFQDKATLRVPEIQQLHNFTKKYAKLVTLIWKEYAKTRNSKIIEFSLTCACKHMMQCFQLYQFCAKLEIFNFSSKSWQHWFKIAYLGDMERQMKDSSSTEVNNRLDTVTTSLTSSFSKLDSMLTELSGRAFKSKYQVLASFFTVFSSFCGTYCHLVIWESKRTTFTN